MKNLLKILSLVLAISFVVIGLVSCGNKAVMTLEVDGKTYTITEAEYDLYMKVVKMNFFINNGYITQYDSVLWTVKTSDGETYGDYYDNYVKNLMKTTLVEKYLFDQFNLTISDEKLAEFKTSVANANKNYGGKGAYKREFGYTAQDFYDLYQSAVEKSNEIIKYLYTGDNAVDKVTADELDKYYNDKYSGFQYIYLDMNNKVEKVEKDGVEYYVGLNAASIKYYVLVTIGDDGVVTYEVKGRVDGKEYTEKEDTAIVAFNTVELSDEEKQEKSTLPSLISKALDEGGDFKELMLKYSDDFNAFKYENGVFISDSGYIVNNSSVMDAARKLEVGKYTEAIGVSDSKYYYIVKKIETKEKAYQDEEYKDLFSTFEENCMYDKYQQRLDTLIEKVTIDDNLVDKFHIADTYLTSYVDTYYYYSQQMGSLTSGS